MYFYCSNKSKDVTVLFVFKKQISFVAFSIWSRVFSIMRERYKKIKFQLYSNANTELDLLSVEKFCLNVFAKLTYLLLTN